jgi:hypothetical protein
VNVALLTDSLCEHYDLTEIRTLWKAILDAALGRVQLPVQINARSRDGSSSSGILVSSMQEAETYMAACRAAVARLDADATRAVNPDALGTSVDLSQRPVLV